MKSVLKGTLLTLFFTQICFAQWFWQNPLPEGNRFNSVSYVSLSMGWITSDFGGIYHTTDGGIS
jgi:photosystem II stability/assembly factor-like uncharacterized protein